MTGGAERAGDFSPKTINSRLARTAQRFGLALGVGSQRAMLEHPDLAHTYRVRDVAPDILLFANLGAVQLNYGFGVAQCREAVDIIGADALMLHLNPLQEYFQKGNLNFAGLLAKIETLCDELAVPVVVKEVGWGIAPSVAQRLVKAGVAAIDVAGAGGTSWAEVEGASTRDHMRGQLVETFCDWGIPTAQAVLDARQALPSCPLIASGGIRNGLDVAKALALGADLAGMAGVLLTAAHQSAADLEQLIERILEELRLAMFVTGSTTLADLRRPGLLHMSR
jgi:isopentenyl-diphosphate delta-isomerase